VKRTTALLHVETIAERLRQTGGIFGTPGTLREAVRVRRAWLFGSVAKGSPMPGDVDIMLDIEAVGRLYRRGQAPLDRRTICGLRFPRDSRNEFLRWLRRDMKMVSLHCRDTDDVKLDVMVMIYPRDDWADVTRKRLRAP
jgi:predicted nucleotidyltransferase